MEEGSPVATGVKVDSKSDDEGQSKIILVLLVAIILLVLAIIAVFLIIYFKSSKASVDNTGSPVDETSAPLTIEQCSADVSLKTGCVQIFKMNNAKDECAKLQGQLKDNCFALLALTLRDTTYCDFIVDGPTRETCSRGPDLRDLGG